MTKEIQASRTCVVCGQKKALLAFLELAGDKGHHYGDICASCRGSDRSKKLSSGGSDQKSGGSTHLQINNETKVQLEHERKEQLKQHADLEYDEKIKKEAAISEKANTSEQREKSEKEYRADYLQKKERCR